MIIAVDFDGTCVTHEFPKVGEDIGAAPVLRKLVENGHKIILYTMRSDRPDSSDCYVAKSESEIKDVTGMFLQDAVDWFKKNNIPLYGIQKNPNQGWTTSPKCYAHLYIDDATLGCPLVENIHQRPYVDWAYIATLLRGKGLI